MSHVPSAAPAPKQSPSKPHIYTLEAAGLLIIGILVLILTLIASWQHIPWGIR
jgi:hypothetical protein